MSKLSDFELGWLAGIIEGEGSLSYQKPFSPKLAVEMCDEDIIYRVAGLFERIAGKPFEVTLCKKNNEAWNDSYRVTAFGNSFEIIFRTVVRHLGSRRRQQGWRALNRFEFKASDRINVVEFVKAFKPEPEAPLAVTRRR